MPFKRRWKADTESKATTASGSANSEELCQGCVLLPKHALVQKTQYANTAAQSQRNKVVGKKCVSDIQPQMVNETRLNTVQTHHVAISCMKICSQRVFKMWPDVRLVLQYH